MSSPVIPTLAGYPKAVELIPPLLTIPWKGLLCLLLTLQMTGLPWKFMMQQTPELQALQG
jgi:hypothetical protein